MSISRIYPNTTDFSPHRRKGRFLIDSAEESRAGLVVSEKNQDASDSREKILELQESEQVWTFFELGNNLALGADNQWKCYLPEFIDAGWKRRLYEQPMAIWDIESGVKKTELKGSHIGEVTGASITNDKQIITWGRDYLIRVWKLSNGEPIEVLPLPVWPDENGIAVLSSQRFGLLPIEEQSRYINERHLPSPTVRIDWIVSPGTEVGLKQHSFICSNANRNENNLEYAITPWVPPTPSSIDPTQHFSRHIEDVENAEAGYSTAFTLNDGRVLAGGTTYGASGYIYLWDGLFDLRILMPGRYSINFELKGETQPGVIETFEPTGIDKGDYYRFRV